MAVLNSFPSLIITCLLACISKRRPTDKGVSFLKDSILLTPRSNLFCVCTTTCRLISFEAWLLNVLVWKRKLLLILWIVLTGWQVESSASTPSFKCLTSSVRAPLSYHWSIHRLTSSYRTSTTKQSTCEASSTRAKHACCSSSSCVWRHNQDMIVSLVCTSCVGTDSRARRKRAQQAKIPRGCSHKTELLTSWHLLLPETPLPWDPVVSLYSLLLSFNCWYWDRHFVWRFQARNRTVLFKLCSTEWQHLPMTLFFRGGSCWTVKRRNGSLEVLITIQKLCEKNEDETRVRYLPRL